LNTPSTRSSTETDRLTIVRLGGSLLHDGRDFLERAISDRLRDLLTMIHHPAVIVGGGRNVDLVRQWNAAGFCSDQDAHWHAIAAMSFHARELCHQLTGFQLVASHCDARRGLEQGVIPVLDVMSILRNDAAEPAADAIPASWDATSDSIAARFAVSWQADLVLLKSVDAGSCVQEHVDACFADIAAPLVSVGWANLRDAACRVRQIPLPHFAALPT